MKIFKNEIVLYKQNALKLYSGGFCYTCYFNEKCTNHINVEISCGTSQDPNYLFTAFMKVK